MVTAVIDPIRIPTVTLSPAEMQELEELIESGQLSKDFIERYHDAVEKNVFGADHKKDRHGNPIEQGLGSALNQTKNSVDAYRKYGNPHNPKNVDPDTPEVYEATLKRMEQELKLANEVRAAKRAKEQADRKKGRRAA